MTRINNADHVLLLLQEQLVRLGKEKAARRATVSGVRGGTPEPIARLRALTTNDGIGDEDIKRVIVRGLLVQQLGEAIGTDTEFEEIANEVTRIIGESPAGRELLDQALQQLSKS